MLRLLVALIIVFGSVTIGPTSLVEATAGFASGAVVAQIGPSAADDESSDHSDRSAVLLGRMKGGESIAATRPLTQLHLWLVPYAYNYRPDFGRASPERVADYRYDSTSSPVDPASEGGAVRRVLSCTVEGFVATRATGGGPGGGGPNFVAGLVGIQPPVPVSQSRMAAGSDRAGFPRTPTSSPGFEYTLPDGSKVRLMGPSGQAPRRASFTNANGGPINPFTGKPVQPPAPAEWSMRDWVRELSHVEQTP